MGNLPQPSPAGIQLCDRTHSSTFKGIFGEPDEESICVTVFERRNIIFLTITLFKFHALPNVRALFSGISLTQHQPRTCLSLQGEPPGHTLHAALRYWIPQILRMRKFFPKRRWRRKKGPSPHPARLAPHPGVVLIEHDDNLRHVVELWDGTEISQSSLPLCILGFLPNARRGGPGPKDEGVSEWAGRQEEACSEKKSEEESKRTLGQEAHRLREEGRSLHPEVPHSGRH